MPKYEAFVQGDCGHFVLYIMQLPLRPVHGYNGPTTDQCSSALRRHVQSLLCIVCKYISQQSSIGPGPSCLTLWGAPAAGRDVACRTHGLSRSIDGAGFRPRGGAERCRSHEGDLEDAEQALGGTHGIHASRLLTMPVADKRPSVIDCSLTDACGRSMAANGDDAGMRCIPIRQPHGRRPGAAPHTTTTRPHQLSRTGCREHSAARGAHGGWPGAEQI